MLSLSYNENIVLEYFFNFLREDRIQRKIYIPSRRVNEVTIDSIGLQLRNQLMTVLD